MILRKVNGFIVLSASHFESVFPQAGGNKFHFPVISIFLILVAVMPDSFDEQAELLHTVYHIHHETTRCSDWNFRKR